MNKKSFDSNQKEVRTESKGGSIRKNDSFDICQNIKAQLLSYISTYIKRLIYSNVLPLVFG